MGRGRRGWEGKEPVGVSSQPSGRQVRAGPSVIFRVRCLFGGIRGVPFAAGSIRGGTFLNGSCVDEDAVSSRPARGETVPSDLPLGLAVFRPIHVYSAKLYN